MKLEEYRTIDLSGYEIATLTGILRYIVDYKDLGPVGGKIAKDIHKKLIKLAED